MKSSQWYQEKIWVAIQGFANGGAQKQMRALAYTRTFWPCPFPVTTPTIYCHAYGFLDGTHHELNKIDW